MIYYNFITVILFLIIFILILKFRDVNVDNFETLNCLDPKNYSLDCDIVKIFNDKKINDKIINIVRADLQNNTGKLNKETNTELDKFIEKNNNTQKDIDSVINNIRRIDDDKKKKLNQYVDEKNNYNKNILNYFDNVKQDNETEQYIYSKDDFKKKNELLRNRLAEYYDAIKKLNPINNSIKCPVKKDDCNKNYKCKWDSSNDECVRKIDILILKNKYNKNELNLREIKNNNTKIYNLIINNGCAAYKYETVENKFVIETGSCSSDETNYFNVVEISDANTYNKYIRYEIKSTDIHEVEDDQYGVEYPFYIITPFKSMGRCVTYNENTLSITPVRNNPHQRFNLSSVSNYCRY